MVNWIMQGGKRLSVFVVFFNTDLFAWGLGCGTRVLLQWQASFSLVVLPGLSCLSACGILVPSPGIEPLSPALQGGFLTTGPPVDHQKSLLLCFLINRLYNGLLHSAPLCGHVLSQQQNWGQRSGFGILYSNSSLCYSLFPACTNRYLQSEVLWKEVED